MRRLGSARSGRGEGKARYPRYAPFSLGVGVDGARIYPGSLLYSVTVISFERIFLKDDPPVNSLAGQDPIPGVKSIIPEIFEGGSSSSSDSGDGAKWKDVGWWGDVYLCWDADSETCDVTRCYLEGPAVPEGNPISALDGSLTRQTSTSGEGGNGKYFVKIGSVSEEGDIRQDFNSDLHWHPTFIPENPGSESSTSSESADSSSSSSDSDSESNSSSSDSSSDSNGSDDPSSDSTDPGSNSSDSSSDASSSTGGGSSDGGGSSGGGSSGGGSSGGGGSSTDSGGGSDNGSDKSSAIVPLDLSPTKYAALLTMEAPEVLFYDVQQTAVSGYRTKFEIDPWFVAVCEPNSLRVVGVTCDRPALVGAKVIGGNRAVFEILGIPFMRPTIAHFQIIGVRRGFNGMRFPLRDKEQFAANERHLNSAYPAKDFSHLQQ